MNVARQAPALTGVSETALMTLSWRASEARRGDGLIHDPMAIQLCETMDIDFAKFGRSYQDIALRALAFDFHTRAYLEQYPNATVVALAEGLQTSFWRLDADVSDSSFRWLTVDLPPIIDLRQRLLPRSPRITACAQSALDYSWMDHVDPSTGVFITAEGLLTYFQQEQALGLIAECARRFPGSRFCFDMPPPRLVRRSVSDRGPRVGRRYRMPHLSFGASPTELVETVGSLPGVRAVQSDTRWPHGRGWIIRARQSIAEKLPYRLDEPWNASLTLVDFAEREVAPG